MPKSDEKLEKETRKTMKWETSTTGSQWLAGLALLDAHSSSLDENEVQKTSWGMAFDFIIEVPLCSLPKSLRKISQ